MDHMRETSWRKSDWLLAAGLLLASLVFTISPLSAALDRALYAVRFALVDRAASGNVVVVEMDAKSASVIKRWPWSRVNYAEAVDRLRGAGAASIVFDVDFSSPSNPAEDEAFAASLKRAEGLAVLPTFGQQAAASDQRTIDALPIPVLRPHVALASVSIEPDHDGQVRRMPFGTITAGTPRPSLSAYIAQRSGEADTAFPIDMSIDPSTIPRLSFVDVRDGRFDPARVRGRQILIGATAIEMGDRYGTASWGVIPGVVVQAMAAETLLRGVPAAGGLAIPLLIAGLAVFGIMRCRSGMKLLLWTTGGALTAIVSILIAQHLFLVTYPLAEALVTILFAGLICGARLIAERFRAQRLIDEETGLPNARSLCAPGAGSTLVVTQLDNYESLLGVLGTKLAAEVVKRVADRLVLIALDAQVYRTAERHLAFVAPPGEAVDDMLDGLRGILLRPIEVAGRRVDVAVSLGCSADGAAGIGRQLVDATLAADEALRAGVFWRRSTADTGDLERSITLMGELDAALAAEQIEVFYQPKYHLRENRITSVEALVRWPHPERGFIAPDLFVPLAETTNRIGPLTLYVLQRVARDLSNLRADHADITAAVNISAKLLSSPSFNAEVETILNDAGVPTSALIFEITESAAMSDPASAIAALDHYREMGIAVSMDDYGTGQSTLTYLRQLPLSELKIDRSFVQHAHNVRNDSVLVRSTVSLAHDLGLKVVAEGVEDLECLVFLRECGCDLAQGYFISRPLPLPQLLTMLAKGYAVAA